MSVRQLGTQVAKAVGQQLESLGFQRQRTVYRRERPGFVERFAIVGDRWNSGAAPWRFSVDVGIYFPDLPTRSDSVGFWREAHAVGTIGAIAETTPVEFEVSQSTVDDVAARVAKAIVAASDKLSTWAPAARERAERGLCSPLPIPENWP
jgi:hypothetical protein